MIRNFRQILDESCRAGKKRLAVPFPRSSRVTEALREAEKTGLIETVMVGDEKKGPFVTKEVLGEIAAMARDGKVDMIFQGDAGLNDFLKAFTAREAGIAGRESMSYISLFELPSEKRLVMLTDTLVHAFPDIRQKVRILENAIQFASTLGVEKPKVAALSIVELVNLSVTSSVDAAVLAKMSERRQLKGVIDGPLDIDCASSKERSRRKGLESPVAGEVDIYFFPDIESSYSIAEVMVFLGKRTLAGALMGTKVPVVLNLRFESPYSLLLDMALASIRC